MSLGNATISEHEHGRPPGRNGAAATSRAGTRRCRPTVAAALVRQGLIADGLAVAAARQGLADGQLLARWRDVVGPELADLATPVRLDRRQRRLVLQATSSASLLLQHRTAELVERINLFFGRPTIRSLSFTPPPRPRPTAACAPVREVATDDLEPTLARVHDDGLRSALRGLAVAMRRSQAR